MYTTPATAANSFCGTFGHLHACIALFVLNLILVFFYLHGLSRCRAAKQALGFVAYEHVAHGND